MHKIIRVTPQIILAIALTVLSSVVGVMIPLMIKQVIDTNGSLPVVSIVLTVVLFVAQTLLVTVGEFMMAKAGEQQVRDIRDQLTKHLLYVPKSFFDQQHSGDLASRVINDSNSIREFLTKNMASFVSGIITIVGSFAALLWLDWRLSLVLFVSLPVVVLLIIPVSNLAERYAKQTQDEIGTATNILIESFQSETHIKANTAENDVAVKAKHSFGKLFQVSVKSDLMESISAPIVLLFLFGAVALIFAYGGRRVAAGTLTVGTLMSFLIYLFQLLNPLGGLSSFFAGLAKMRGASAKISALFAVAQEKQAGITEVPEGDLSLDDVSFGYDGNSVLEDVDLQIPQHKKIAIVGPSGGGKSTIINLIERLYTPKNGTIRLGNVNANEYGLREWRRNFGLVSQENTIMQGTVRDNLLFGLSERYSEQQINEALTEAGLAEDIANLPKGLDTEVGEQGVMLSGGQRQRLQIAHVYLAEPAVIIFDEATANLDADSEFQVTSSLNKLLKNRTALIVAHRLSTVVDADIIYFLENKHITGVGTHKELMESHAAYRRYVQEQIIN